MIEKVITMNLERRIDKLFFIVGALRVSGFPIHLGSFTWDDFLVRSVSHDGDLYTSAEAVCNAAVDDGFEWFSNFPSAFEGEEDSKYICAWTWTWASTLRKSAQLDRTVMLLIDDTTPAFMWTYERYNGLAIQCASDSDFKVLQLGTHADRMSDKLPVPELFTSIIGRGFMGEVNQGIILNKGGAELLLEAQATPPFVFPCRDMLKIMQWGQEDKKFFNGLYHTLDPVIDTNVIGESDLFPSYVPP